MSRTFALCLFFSAFACFSLYAEVKEEAIDYCIKFDGESSYVDLDTMSYLDPHHALTLSLQAYHPSWDAIRNNPTIAGNTQYGGYALSVLQHRIAGWILLGDSHIRVEYPTRDLTPGWHHLVVTFDGYSTRLYIDGLIRDEVVTENKNEVFPTDATASFMVGAETRHNKQPHPDPEYFFDGAVDDLTIWSRAMSASEVVALGSGAVDVSDVDLLAYYDFNQRDGVFLDASTYEGRAAIIGEAQVIESTVPYLLPKAFISIELLDKILLVVMVLLFFIACFFAVTKKKLRPILLVVITSLTLSLFVLQNTTVIHWLAPEGMIPFWGEKLMISLSALFLSTGLFYGRSLAIGGVKKHLITKLYSYFPYATLIISFSFWSIPIAYHFHVMVILYVIGMMYFYDLSQQTTQSIRAVVLISFGVIILTATIHVLVYFERIATIYSAGMIPPVTLFFSAFAFYLLNQKEPKKTQDEDDPLLATLSEREREVLDMMSEGMTDKEIAERMFISHHTVRTHAKKIYAKLEVRNRTEAVQKLKNTVYA